MARMSKAERETRDQARAAILYKLNTADEGEYVEHDDLRDTVGNIDGMGDDTFDEVLAELVASGSVQHDTADNAYMLAVDIDDDDDPHVALPSMPERDGYGYLVIEAPLDLVAAYARLHPAEQGTMSVASAGTLRNMLIEMGKMRPGTPVPDDVPSHIVVAPEG